MKEGRGGNHQEDIKHASAGKEKKGRPRKRWLDNIREEYKTAECGGKSKFVAHEDKGRCITT